MSLINRRFNAILAGLGLKSGLTPASALFARGPSSASAPGRQSSRDPEILRLSRNGWMPNNEHLPVLIYRSVIRPVIRSGTDIKGNEPTLHLAEHFEAIFQRNGWPAQWRNGIYSFHHYHSTAHEVLGFAAGHGRILLGGENGHEVEVHGGDVAVLPTGTGHCRIELSDDFLVVGAYPPDQHWDICRDAPDAEAVRRMQHLPFPSTDPVEGSAGPLVKLWTNS